MALEPIIFEGGSWDGRYCEIHKGDLPARSAERLRPDRTGHDVYVRSADTVEFVKKIKLRPGPNGEARFKDKPMISTVFKYAGTKPAPAWMNRDPESTRITRERTTLRLTPE
jgi:hypothetical protein